MCDHFLIKLCLPIVSVTKRLIGMPMPTMTSIIALSIEKLRLYSAIGLKGIVQ